MEQCDRALLLGYGPFATYARNPSGDLAQMFDGRRLPCGLVIEGRVLPSSYHRGPAESIRLLQLYQPVVVLALGLSSRVPVVRLEARGRNWREHEYADADGLRCSGERIDPSGEDYHEVDPSPIYLGRWLERCGVHTEVSTDANAFICNALLYELAELARNRGVPFAYAHVPFTERYQDVPVDRPRILQAELELAVEVILISLYRYYHEKS